MKRVFLQALFLVVVLTSCTGEEIDKSAERAAILARDKEWAAAAASGDVELALSFWAEDAVVFAPGAPPFKGKAAIRRMLQESMSLPGFRVSWQASEIVVGSSGDLAYETATNAFTVNDQLGNPVTTTGKAVTVWRKDPDRVWRCVVDIWNSDPPARQGS